MLSFLTGIGGIIYIIIYKYTVIEDMQNYVIKNGQKPMLSSTSYVLSIFLGVFTLFIWPLINFVKMYALWNQCTRIYNTIASNQTEEAKKH